MTKSSARSGLYAFVVARVVRRPLWAFVFLLSSIMHAVGHAAVALLAGALAQSMVGGRDLSAARSIVRVHVLSGGETPVSLALFGLAAVLLKVVGGIAASYVQGTFAGEIGCDVRARLLDALLGRTGLRSPGHSDQGDEVGVIGRETSAIAELTVRVREVESGFSAWLAATRSTVQLLGIAILLLGLAPRLAAFALVALAPFALAQQIARRAYKRESARLAHQGDALFEAADEAVRHVDLWRTYGAQRRIRAHVERLGAVIGRRAARLEAMAAALSGANELLGALALVIVLFVASRGGIASGEPLLPFAVAFFLAYRPLREVSDARLALSRAQASFDALAPTLAAADEQGERHDDAASEVSRASTWDLEALRVRGLTLSRGALGAIDLDVAPGEIVALVAPTGSGKTTLLRTLLGLEASREGSVHYGARSIDEASLGPSARPFAWVPQEAPLLADSLHENVRLGADAIDLAALLEPLGAARLVDELGASRHGPRLGSGGRALSGGERQWVALARALATRLPVLLLDEPTSGLDPASQRRVLDAVASLRGARSVILVTHREEPISIADRVLRLRPHDDDVADASPRSAPRITAA